jgi:hypothetical protein
MKTDYEKANAVENYLTPELIMEYERDRIAEKARKHDERITQIQNPELSDDKVFEKYRELGGGDRFLKWNDHKVRAQNKKLNEVKMTYDEIISHENNRVDFYKDMLKQANEPVETVNTLKAELSGQIEVLKEYQKKLEECKTKKA